MQQKVNRISIWGAGVGRISYLDALMCLGIILVIEGHVRQLGMGIKVYDTLPGMILYSFNMPLFFFVSGLLAYKSYIGIEDFFNNSSLKIQHTA